MYFPLVFYAFVFCWLSITGMSANNNGPKSFNYEMCGKKKNGGENSI